MNTEQMVRFWLDGYPLTPTFREERAKQIITALLAEREALLGAANKTIADNLHLADGEDCTLYDLKQAIAMCEEYENVP